MGDNDQGVLAKADTIAIDMAAMLMDKVRRGNAKTAEQNLMVQILRSFGMTPHGRLYV